MKKQLNRINGWFSFCLRIVAVICACTMLLTAQSDGITAKDPKAKEAVDAALKALGGADKIGGIKSLIIKGTRTFGSSTREFEIRILLPDNFIQITQYSQTIEYRGVSQETLIPPITPIAGGSGKLSPEDIRIIEEYFSFYTNNMKDEWSYFLMGALMKAGPTPLTISSGSKPGVFALTKNDGATGEIEFQSETGYPFIIRYKEVVRERDASGSATPKEVSSDYSIIFRDHFSFDGIMFPRSITSTGSTGALRIKEVQINPKLSLKDFEMSQNPSDRLRDVKMIGQ